jgi:hypothetical protein
MAFVIARLITLPTVAIGSAWLIARYRAVGVVISICAGWAVLFAVYRGFPVPPSEWDEDGEEIPYTAPILMMIWCFSVWGVVSLWSWFKRQREVTR